MRRNTRNHMICSQKKYLRFLIIVCIRCMDPKMCANFNFCYASEITKIAKLRLVQFSLYGIFSNSPLVISLSDTVNTLTTSVMSAH